MWIVVSFTKIKVQQDFSYPDFIWKKEDLEPVKHSQQDNYFFFFLEESWNFWQEVFAKSLQQASFKLGGALFKLLSQCIPVLLREALNLWAKGSRHIYYCLFMNYLYQSKTRKYVITAFFLSTLHSLGQWKCAWILNESFLSLGVLLHFKHLLNDVFQAILTILQWWTESE